MNYIAHLIHSKGLGQLVHRGLVISRHYGATPEKMMRAFDQLIGTLEQYGCRATFPVTAVALARHPTPFHRLQERGMELAIHGWTHVNLERYSLEQQREHLARAMDIFGRYHIPVKGFRSPYLRHNSTIRETVEAMGLRYVSDQPILWEITAESLRSLGRNQAYQRAVAFYAPWSSVGHLSLPVVQGQIVEIPVSLPDDEMLAERLEADSDQIAQIWTEILHQTYVREELFTIQFHPERATICTPALNRVLSEARSYNPPVWIARLDEIAGWWQQRQALRIDVTQEDPDQYNIVIYGPTQANALVRSAQVIGDSTAWGDGYQLVKSRCFSVRCNTRPFIGISRRTSRPLINFLEQQGYLVEIHDECTSYPVHLDWPNFTQEDEGPLIRQIEATRSPLIRISRWPGGARSVLTITGDVDALTLWDYGLRLFGK
ncbi:MAG: polysaccharide deacetylase family protein [Anaerolineae bacterium]|jgi:peptidoglycan/xylan/chitin deacetylase (PgdA/CDA1 family)|nr:polysaccharide deacetylase family protein [Anaerolineae bacterium]MDH7473685.1 polysaccharide deacetylase family protein [Anaerolineae bacterium]